MKILALLVWAAALSFSQGREGNFTIRLEPTAALQANAEIPFAIHVTDDLHKPVIDAKVTLQVENSQGADVRVFRASATEPGVYISKPVFPAAGQWAVYVEVHRGGELATRTIEYNVPDALTP